MTLPEEIRTAVYWLNTDGHNRAADQLVQCVEKLLAELERMRAVTPIDVLEAAARAVLSDDADTKLLGSYIASLCPPIQEAPRSIATPQPIIAEPSVLGAGQMPQPQAPASMEFYLDSDEIETLVRFCSSDDPKEKPSSLRFDIGNGHSGMGLYASLAEYPDEGSIFLGAAVLVIAPQPITKAAGESADEESGMESGLKASATVSFQYELQALVNRHSKEAGCNTPDFILASYMGACLDAFNAAVQDRERWYGRGPEQPTVGPHEPPRPPNHHPRG